MGQREGEAPAQSGWRRIRYPPHFALRGSFALGSGPARSCGAAATEPRLTRRRRVCRFGAACTALLAAAAAADRALCAAGSGCRRRRLFHTQPRRRPVRRLEQAGDTAALALVRIDRDCRKRLPTTSTSTRPTSASRRLSRRSRRFSACSMWVRARRSSAPRPLPIVIYAPSDAASNQRLSHGQSRSATSSSSTTSCSLRARST